jgi:hypothetical protein
MTKFRVVGYVFIIALIKNPCKDKHQDTVMFWQGQPQ